MLAFSEAIRTATFDVTGEPGLPLVGYGAFTVGVQFEDGAGETRLQPS